MAGERRDGTATARCTDASLIIVGDELLDGSTTDLNGPHIARRLKALGVGVREIHVTGDDESSIADAVRSLAKAHDLVIVTGGLGPTHDDVTAKGVAMALGLPLEDHSDALQALQNYHKPHAVPVGRMPAARLPKGCKVYPDGISGSSGFRIGNIIVLPGTPSIAAHLFELAAADLPNGTTLAEAFVRVPLIESEISDTLRAVQAQHTSVRIGCYPYFGNDAGVTLVLRSSDPEALAVCESTLRAAFSHLPPPA